MTQMTVNEVDLSSEGRIQCDSCSARAGVVVALPYGHLTFCMHHYNKNAGVLTDQGGTATLISIADKTGNIDD